jgi:hypothetical protein
MVQEALSEIMERREWGQEERGMMEEGNERTLPLVITDSFEIVILYMVCRLLGPLSIDITS